MLFLDNIFRVFLLELKLSPMISSYFLLGGGCGVVFGEVMILLGYVCASSFGTEDSRLTLKCFCCPVLDVAFNCFCSSSFPVAICWVIDRKSLSDVTIGSKRLLDYIFFLGFQVLILWNSFWVSLSFWRFIIQDTLIQFRPLRHAEAMVSDLLKLLVQS